MHAQQKNNKILPVFFYLMKKFLFLAIPFNLPCARVAMHFVIVSG